MKPDPRRIAWACASALMLALPLFAHAHEKVDPAQSLRIKMLSVLLSPAANTALTDVKRCKPAVAGSTLRQDVIHFLTAASKRAFQTAEAMTEGGITHCRFTIGQEASRQDEGWSRVYRFDLGANGSLLPQTLDCFTIP